MTTLEQILDLAAQARRSPHARRVLFDALIDRYGNEFLNVVERAQTYADQDGRSFAIYLSPERLRQVEQWDHDRTAGHVRPHARVGTHAFHIMNLAYRLAWRTSDEVLVAVIRPQDDVADR